MFKYFDAHSHLNLPQFDKDREEQIKKLKDLEIGTITVGTDYETSKFAVDLAGRHANLWATVGLHPIEHDRPGDITDNDKEVFDYAKYKELAQNSKVVAIGECGLDYYRDASQKEKQKGLFIKHIDLALELDLPLMIHSRPSKDSMDAYEDALEILEARRQKLDAGILRGNFHFFVGNIEIAKRALALGFTMSFDGPMTFARDYDEVIKFLPLESILAETDAPFAAPAPFRGQRCEPTHVIEVVKKIAEIRGEDLEKVREILAKNIIRVFGIDSKN